MSILSKELGRTTLSIPARSVERDGSARPWWQTAALLPVLLVLSLLGFAAPAAAVPPPQRYITLALDQSVVAPGTTVTATVYATSTDETTYQEIRVTKPAQLTYVPGSTSAPVDFDPWVDTTTNEWVWSNANLPTSMIGNTFTFDEGAGPDSGVPAGQGLAQFTADDGPASLSLTARALDGSNVELAVSGAVTLEIQGVDAGGPYSGEEGSDIAINGVGTGLDPEFITYTWSYAPVSGVDAGASCTFANDMAAVTTVTCTDDGLYRLTLTAQEFIDRVANGSAPGYSDTADLLVTNAVPVVTISAPTAGASFPAGAPIDDRCLHRRGQQRHPHLCRGVLRRVPGHR